MRNKDGTFAKGHTLTIQHGHCCDRGVSTTYRAWLNMRERCAKHPKYKHVNVDPEWNESFMAFYDDMGRKPDGSHLHRIDPNNDYNSDNCRWIPADEHYKLHSREPRKLRPEEAEMIKQLCDQGVPQRLIGKMFNTCQTNISRINRK